MSVPQSLPPFAPTFNLGVSATAIPAVSQSQPEIQCHQTGITADLHASTNPTPEASANAARALPHAPAPIVLSSASPVASVASIPSSSAFVQSQPLMHSHVQHQTEQHQAQSTTHQVSDVQPQVQSSVQNPSVQTLPETSPMTAQTPQSHVPQSSHPTLLPSLTSDEQSTDLYRKYRPKTLDQFHGQPAAVHSVTKWFSDSSSPCPQVVLVTGPTGVGKTTLVKIIASMLGAEGEMAYREYNIGEDNGIDTIREVSRNVQFRSITGGNKVLFLDETALMRKNAQQALLKVLEQLPKKVYIFLATTHPDNLEPTVRNRCVQLALKSLPPEALYAALTTVLQGERRTLDNAVVTQLIEQAGGSGRQLMTLLQRILTSDKPAGQLVMLNEIESPAEGDVAKEIAYQLAGWQQVQSWAQFSALLGQLDFKKTSPESLRIYILSCLKTALLRSPNPYPIMRIVDKLRHPYYNPADSAVFLSDMYIAHAILTQPQQ